MQVETHSSRLSPMNILKTVVCGLAASSGVGAATGESFGRGSLGTHAAAKLQRDSLPDGLAAPRAGSRQLLASRQLTSPQQIKSHYRLANPCRTNGTLDIALTESFFFQTTQTTPNDHHLTLRHQILGRAVGTNPTRNYTLATHFSSELNFSPTRKTHNLTHPFAFTPKGLATGFTHELTREVEILDEHTLALRNVKGKVRCA